MVSIQSKPHTKWGMDGFNFPLVEESQVDSALVASLSDWDKISRVTLQPKPRLSKSTWIQKLQDQLWAQISRCWENVISHAAIYNLINCTCWISSKSICASNPPKKSKNIPVFVTAWDLYLTYLIDFQHFPRSFEWFDTSHRMPPCLDLRLWRQVVLQHLHGPTTPFLCH